MAACVNRRVGNLERSEELVAEYQEKFPTVYGEKFTENYRHYAETGRDFVWH